MLFADAPQLAYGLQLKDVIGPIVSIAAAAVAVVFSRRTLRLSEQKAERDLNLEAQKMLLEINRQLISDPCLWSIYDDHPVRATNAFATWRAGDLSKAKLEAFAYLKLNMFEVVLVEIPNPGPQERPNVSNVWLNFFHDSLARSSTLRGILERPDAPRLYNRVLLALYSHWKDPKPKLAAQVETPAVVVPKAEPVTVLPPVEKKPEPPVGR